MPFWIAEGGEDGTCAGSRITKSMHFYSQDLYTGCDHFSKLAKSFDSEGDIRMANSAALFFAVSAIEAKLNEDIAATVAILNDDNSWSDLEFEYRRSPLKEKWNAVARKRCGVLWNSGAEPFQSFALVSSLRNELVHYKGEMLGKDETPSKAVAEIMKRLGVRSKASFTDDDCSSWANDLLNHSDLGEWVFRSITPLWDNMHDLLGSEH